MLKHYLFSALRNALAAPLASAMNVVTLALGLACFATAYAFVSFWQSAEQHFAKADRIAVMTTSIALADDSFSFDGDPHVPEHAARYLREDFPAIQEIARAVTIDQQTMVAAGDRALRAFGVAVDPEFLDLFELPFIAGDARAALSAPGSVVLTKDLAAKLFGNRSALNEHILIGNVADATVTGVIDAVPEPSHLGRSSAAVLKFDLLTSRDVLETVRKSMPVAGQTAPDGEGDAADDKGSAPTNAKEPGREQDAAKAPARENWLNATAVTYLLLPADGSFRLAALRTQLPNFTKHHVPPELAGFATIRHDAIPLREVLSRAVNSELFFRDVGVSVGEMLLALGALVLAVACVNYANLATARAARRTREVGLRKALGASGRQIALQHVLEAALLTVMALAVALIAVRVLLPLLDTLVGADLAPTFFSASRFWVFALATLVTVTVAAGAYPALVLSNVPPAGALRASRAQLGSKRLSTWLIGVQFAAAGFLVIAVTIAALQNAHLQRTGLGLDADPLLLIENTPGTTKVDSATLRQELARLPQVKGVTEIAAPPWVSWGGSLISRSEDPTAPAKMIGNRGVGFDFFDVFGIHVLAGRVFGKEYGDEKYALGSGDRPAKSDSTKPADPQPIVVDRAFLAELGFDSPQAAVDQIVYVPQRMAGAFGGQSQPLRIVGVVENRPYVFFGGLGTDAVEYRLGTQLRFQVVRIARDDVTGALEAIGGVWRQLAPGVAINRHFLDDFFAQAYSTYLRVGQVLTGLAVLALLISVSGLFGMAALVAGRRLREIGVRKAHGATHRQIAAMLIASFSMPVIAANVIVWPLAWFAARAYLATFRAPIALTPLPFVFSLVVTLAIAWLAVGAQLTRAARARPAEVLRYE
jgi:putative ABC transport system permease protein